MFIAFFVSDFVQSKTMISIGFGRGSWEIII